MYRSFSYYLFFIVLLFSSQRMDARHIIGGDISYECMGMDTINGTVTFKFVCTVYRDCFGGGAEFDPNFEFGIYVGRGSNWSVFEIRNVNLSSKRFIPIDTANPCIIVPPNVCVEQGVYEFTRTLPIQSANYMIAFQRCCRNNTISNIFDPGDQGAAYTIEITPEAQNTCNNSPKFRTFPPIVICAESPLRYDHGADDIENDNLVYEFCSPLTAGGQLGSTAQNPCPLGSCDCVTPNPRICLPPFQQVDFRVPAFTALRPIPGNPAVEIDQVTGLITGTPRDVGQFVVGVCVNEYRNGVLMSTFRRDFQFNITNCEQGVNALIQAAGMNADGEFVINSCGDSIVDFINLSNPSNFIKDYLWIFDVNGQFDSLTNKDVTYAFPGLGEYGGSMILNRTVNFEECKDTAFFDVNVFPEIAADFEYDYDTCVAGPVSFQDLSISGSGSITDWQWDFDDDGASSNNQNPNHTYITPGRKDVILEVTDINECVDEITLPISYFPVPPVIIVEPTSFLGCAPARITFVNLSVPIDETYDILWDFGDGGTSDEISPTHIYNEPGAYTVKVDITSPIGCFVDAEFSSLITIEESPVADFDFNPKELSSFQKKVDFTDLSIDASTWQWTFDDEAVLFDQNPTYTFQDTGMHRIEQIVIHENGCPDTLVKFIDVVPTVTYFLPNAFTPNRDGDNDGFFGVGFLEGMTNFSMSIWNRWGERVFFSTDPTEEWNGRKNNDGLDSPEGVYIYNVQYTEPRGQERELKGYVTIIR